MLVDLDLSARMRTADQVTVTGTGYFGTCRRDIRQLVCQLGAQYSGDLTYGVTTHLVCKDSCLPDSEKVTVASAWGIPIVQHEWLLDSLQQGTFLSVDRYCLARNTSVPAKLLSDSVILRPGKQKATNYNTASSSPPECCSTDAIDVEVLRSNSSPVACQLADLLLATPTSPATGIWQDLFLMQFYTHQHGPKALLLECRLQCKVKVLGCCRNQS